MLVVDHLWNREFFVIGENIGSDLLLGITMTGVIFIVWAMMIMVYKIRKLKKLLLSEKKYNSV